MAEAAANTQAPPQTPYAMMGGEDAVRRLVNRFYDLMETQPAAARIRAMHAGDLGGMREKLYQFFSGWLGGPALYFQRPDAKCMNSAHRPFQIDAAAVEAWLACMAQALRDTDTPPAVIAMVEPPMRQMGEMLRNT